MNANDPNAEFYKRIDEMCDELESTRAHPSILTQLIFYIPLLVMVVICMFGIFGHTTSS